MLFAHRMRRYQTVQLKMIAFAQPFSAFDFPMPVKLEVWHTPILMSIELA